MNIDHSPHSPVILDSTTVAELHSSQCQSQFTPEHLAKIWNAGIGMAKDRIHHAVVPLNQHYQLDHLNLHSQYLGGNRMIDHVDAKYKSICGHIGRRVPCKYEK